MRGSQRPTQTAPGGHKERQESRVRRGGRETNRRQLGRRVEAARQRSRLAEFQRQRGSCEPPLCPSTSQLNRSTCRPTHNGLRKGSVEGCAGVQPSSAGRVRGGRGSVRCRGDFGDSRRRGARGNAARGRSPSAGAPQGRLRALGGGSSQARRRGTGSSRRPGSASGTHEGARVRASQPASRGIAPASRRAAKSASPRPRTSRSTASVLAPRGSAGGVVVSARERRTGKAGPR